MNRHPQFYLDDILAAATSIIKFVEGMSEDNFKEDDKTSSAVIRKFEIIGEAVRQLPQSLKDQHPELPWKDIAGMRDRLIHGYFGVDYDLVWQTIHNRLPDLIEKVEAIKAGLSEN